MKLFRTIIIIQALIATVIGLSCKIYACKSSCVYQDNQDTRYYNTEVLNDTITSPCQYTVTFNEEYIRVIDQMNTDTYDFTGHYNDTHMRFYPDSNALGITTIRILDHALYLIDEDENWKLRLTLEE